MKIPSIEYIKTNIEKTIFIKNNYEDFCKHLNELYPDKKFSEQLYIYYFSEYKCPICGCPTKFLSFNRGYQLYCSSKCAGQSADTKNKRKHTNINKYGNEYATKSDIVRDKIIQTNIEKYGVTSTAKTQAVKEKAKQTKLEKYGDEFYNNRDKMKSTNIERYGIDSPIKLQKFFDKSKQTKLEKYGNEFYNNRDKAKYTNIKRYDAENPMLNKIIQQKCLESYRKSKLNNNKDLIGYTDDGDRIYNCQTPSCSACEEKCFIIPSNVYYDRLRQGVCLCTRLLPIGKYTKGTTIELFIRELLDKHNIEYITNNRKIISPKELDIYIPSKKLAIECNGIYSHSTNYKQPSYHVNKTKDCRTNGIELIHIWEDWVRNKPEIVKSIILNKLGLLKTEVIYARKTIIKEVNPKECNDFLERNHIQGKSQSTIKYGLYYNDELVSVMTFSKPRVNMGGKDHKCQWELVRFCSKLNTRVVGGASKLLNYFIKHYNPDSIVSFSSNDISNGNLYKQLGFESDMKYQNSYWYIEPGSMKRYHRSSFTKSEIVKKGYKDIVDDTWTEKEVMEELGFFCIYDSGQFKWILDLKKAS